jgi:hypothetical protein
MYRWKDGAVLVEYVSAVRFKVSVSWVKTAYTIVDKVAFCYNFR